MVAVSVIDSAALVIPSNSEDSAIDSDILVIPSNNESSVVVVVVVVVGDSRGALRRDRRRGIKLPTRSRISQLVSWSNVELIKLSGLLILPLDNLDDGEELVHLLSRHEMEENPHLGDSVRRRL